MAKRKSRVRQFGSPIETQLRNAICLQAARVESHELMLFDYSTSTKPAIAVIENGCFSGVADHDSWDVREDLHRYGDGWMYAELYGGVQIDKYRADLLLWLDCTSTAVAIECDGHDWHERTKQQASSDRARDRALLRLIVHTLRFTGSDIHHDADACAVEVIEIAKLLQERSFETGSQQGFSIGADACRKHHPPGMVPVAATGRNVTLGDI